MTDRNGGQVGRKWVSQRTLAQQQASAATRVAPPPPRSGGGGGEPSHSHKTNSSNSNNSHNTTGNSSPTVQPQHPRSGSDLGSGNRGGAPSASTGRLPIAAGSGHGHGNSSANGMNRASSGSRRQYPSLFTEAGEVAPPQPRSVQMATGKSSGGGSQKSTPASAFNATHNLNQQGSAQSRPSAAPVSSYIPTPRHGTVSHAEQNEHINDSRTNSSGAGVASRWAQLGSGATAQSVIGGGNGEGGLGNGGAKRTMSGSGNLPGSLSTSNSGPFSQSDIGGCGVLSPSLANAVGATGGGSPFVDSTGPAPVGSSAAFTPPLLREQQRLQQLPPLQQQMQANLAAQAGLARAVDDDSEYPTGPMLVAATTLANGGSLPPPSSQPLPVQQELLPSTAGMSSEDFNAMIQMLTAALGTSSDAGTIDALSVANNQQFPQPQAFMRPPTHEVLLQPQPAGDLLSLLSQSSPGAADPRSDQFDSTGAAVSFQNMMEMLVGTGGKGGEGCEAGLPVADGSTAAPSNGENMSSLLAALTRGSDSLFSPSPKPSPQQQGDEQHQDQQQGTTMSQFLDFGNAFGTGFSPVAPPLTGTTDSDPIAAALFSQLTGEGDAAAQAPGGGPPSAADTLEQPSPHSQPLLGHTAVDGAASRGSTRSADSIPLPQPRSTNLRELFSELTQPTARPAAVTMSDPANEAEQPSTEGGGGGGSDPWPSLSALSEKAATRPTASSGSLRGATSRPMSMAEAIMGSNRAASSTGTSGAWRQVASQGGSAATSPSIRANVGGKELTTFASALAPTPLKELSISGDSAHSAAASGTPLVASANRRGSERSPMALAPASAATPLSDPLLGGGRSSQPNTPAGSSMRLHRASLEAPTVTRSAMACIFRETPQSLGRRAIAIANHDKPAALCRSAHWPPANEAETERLLKSKDALKLLRHLTIIGFSRQHVKGVQDLFDAWARNGIPAPDMGFGAYYFYVKEKSDKMLCMKHNGRGATPGHGYGKCDFESRRPNSTCRYEHVCLFCRSKEHGWFEEGKCDGYLQLLSEVERLGVVEEDVETMLNAMEKSSAWSH